MPPTITATEQLSRKASEVTGVDAATNNSKDLISTLNEKTRAKRHQSELEQFNQIVIKAKTLKEGLEVGEDQEKLQFFNEAFGEDVWPSIQSHYEQAETLYKKVLHARLAKMNGGKKTRMSKPEFKEHLMGVL